MTKTKINWPAKLKGLRRRLKLTQLQAAELLNVPYRTFVNWEVGHQKPRKRSAERIEKFSKIAALNQ